jgi:epoxyqueuosine reductase QueG
LDGKGSINVRKCRSWIAGQKRGALTKEEQIALQGALFGCSVCSSCCPDATVHISDYKVDAMAVFQMPTSQLRRIIKGTALEHSGTTLLKRNAAAALCRQSPALAPQLLAMTDSPAIQDSIKAWL